MKLVSKILFVSGLALTAAACSSDDGSNKLSNLFFFNSAKAPEASAGPTEARYCPKVDIVEGGSNMSVGGGYATIGDLARECHVREDGSVVVKVGVAGRVIPSGDGGRYSVPVQFRIKVGDKVLAQGAQTVTATFSGDNVRGEFAAVQDGFVVPRANNQNFDIEVGLGGGKRR